MGDDPSVSDDVSRTENAPVAKSSGKKNAKDKKKVQRTEAQQYEDLKELHRTTALAAGKALHNRNNQLISLEENFAVKCVQHHAALATLVSKLENLYSNTFVDFEYEDASKTGMYLAGKSAYVRSIDDLNTLSYGIMEMAKLANIHVFSDYDGLNNAVYRAMVYFMTEENKDNTALETLAVLEQCIGIARGVDCNKSVVPHEPPNYSFSECEAFKMQYLQELFPVVKPVDDNGGAYGLMILVAVAFLPCVPTGVVKEDIPAKNAHPLRDFLDCIRLMDNEYGENWRNGLRAVGYLLLAETEVNVSAAEFR